MIKHRLMNGKLGRILSPLLLSKQLSMSDHSSVMHMESARKSLIGLGQDSSRRVTGSPKSLDLALKLVLRIKGLLRLLKPIKLFA